jgi:hypothetical protein
LEAGATSIGFLSASAAFTADRDGVIRGAMESDELIQNASCSSETADGFWMKSKCVDGAEAPLEEAQACATAGEAVAQSGGKFRS